MCRSQEEQDESGESRQETHVGLQLAHQLAHRHSCSAGGHSPSPPDAPALSLCFGGVAVLFYLKGQKKGEEPQFSALAPQLLERCSAG